MNDDDPAEQGEENGREEVARRVRRTVGFKVMRDLHREADAMDRERRSRPRLVLLLAVLIALIAACGLAAVWFWYR